MAAGRRGPPAYQRMPLTSLRQSLVAPVISPMPTVVALITGALRDREHAHTPPPVRSALLARLRRRDIATLLPIGSGARHQGSGGRPNEIVPASPGASLDDELDVVRTVEPERIASGIGAALAAGHPAAAWRPVQRAPARWLRDYVDAIRRAWLVIEPIWSRSGELLDRDVERVSVAIARGAGAELITQLFPYATVDGDDLLLPSHSDRGGRVRAADRLLLLPLLASSASAGWTDDYGDVCLAVRYSVPGTWRAFDRAPPPSASLTALVGLPRAAILRRLDTPATAGELAGLLHGTPSMVTHHLRALETAGLVERRRDGRNVWVHRTSRGTELMAMYERT